MVKHTQSIRWQIAKELCLTISWDWRSQGEKTCRINNLVNKYALELETVESKYNELVQSSVDLSSILEKVKVRVSKCLR